MGGMCARVCPTETLCEQACVREAAEGKPVRIGLLQRHATDRGDGGGQAVLQARRADGQTVAIVGAGPAGLACAHRLAMKGHDVEIFEARPKAGGLNEYGIAAYKTVDGFAQAEVDYITAIGGITIHHGKALGRDMQPRRSGRRTTTRCSSPWASAASMRWARPMRRRTGPTTPSPGSRSCGRRRDLAHIPVGRRVVVIGGGMTAIDAASQAKGLGADEVTICYRGPRERMKASPL